MNKLREWLKAAPHHLNRVTTDSGARLLTLVALFLHGASLQIQYPAGILGLLRAQLFSHLLHILRVQVLEDTRPEPLTLKNPIKI